MKVIRETAKNMGWFPVALWFGLALAGPGFVVNWLLGSNEVVKGLLVIYMLVTGVYMAGFMEGYNRSWKNSLSIIDRYSKIATDYEASLKKNNAAIQSLMDSVNHWRGRAERAERRRSNTYEDEVNDDN